MNSRDQIKFETVRHSVRVIKLLATELSSKVSRSGIEDVADFRAGLADIERHLRDIRGALPDEK